MAQRAWRTRRRGATALAVLAALAAATPAPAAPVDHFVDDDTPVAEIPVPGAGQGLLVVTLGDSVASGEGNPDHGRWRSRECHRSAVAGVQRATRLLAQTALRRPPITFVSLACSGATIHHGVVGRYDGIEPRARPGDVPAQIDGLRALVARAGRPADAVLISVGANDVHFGDVVRRCLQPATRPCSGTRYAGTTLDQAVREALAALPAGYDELATTLKRERLVADDGRVLLTEYFDPTRDARGQTCHAIAGGMTARELAWAQDSLLAPLNATVAAAAHRHGWTLVGGIADAFAGHGACAGPQRWVRTLSEALAAGNPTGTLHPSDPGHAAIAQAIAARLGPKLGLTPGGGGPAAFVAPKDDDRPAVPWDVVALVMVVLVLLALVLATKAGRKRLDAFVARGEPPEDRPHEPRRRRSQPRPLAARSGSAVFAHLALRVATTLGALVLTTGFVVVVGATLVWVRFWAARFPADQAVDAVGRGELLVVGAQAIGVFAGLALVAVAVLWAVDGTTNTHRTRATLALLVGAELVAAVLIGGFNARERVQLTAGFVVMAVALLMVVNAVGRVKRRWPRTFPERLAGLPRAWLFDVGDGGGLKPWLRGALQVLPLAVCAATIAVAATADGAWTRGVLVGLLTAVAALLFLVPGAATRQAGGPGDGHLSAARTVIALTVLTSLLVLVGRDEPWLTTAAGLAVTLAGLCLLVAHATDDQLAPVAVVVFFTVCAFGAAVTCLRFLDSPTAQPVAMLLKDDRAVCGVWVGESEGRVWYARLPLAERGDVRRPAPRNSALASVRREEVVDLALGPMQDVGRAQVQAAALRQVLAVEHGAASRDVGSCGPARPPAQRVEHTPERALARAVQPELILSRDDGFWPVSVTTIFAMQDRRAHLCRRVADGVCVRVASVADLPFNGGEGEYLDHPADVGHVGDQKRLLTNALGSVDPAKSQRVYYLVTRGEGADAPYTVQFWFYYTYNYLKTGAWVKAGLHEGDFETIAMLVSARTHQPRYVWMNRHATEGRMFLWEEDRLKKTSDGHLIAYAAKGSHASYETCEVARRPEAPYGLIDDRPECRPDEELHLAPEATHLIDISRAGWACWRGNFGETTRDDLLGRTPYIIDHGPRSPLWQQRYGGTTFEPCRGVRVTARRDVDARHGAGEEVLDAKTSQRLRTGAGRLDGAVDQCADWEHAPATGVLLVACDQRDLTRYLRGGLEAPAGGAGLRIDVAGGMGVRTGPVTVPAVRRDPWLGNVDRWWVTAGQTTTAEIYASCEVAGGMLEARFRAVAVSPRRALRLDTSRPDGTWDLVDATGDSALAHRVTPARVGGPRGDGARPPACGAGVRRDDG